MKLRENALLSPMMTAVGMCFGSVLIAKPNSASWMIGQPDDHAERDAVAPQLKELLEDDAPPARYREHDAFGHDDAPKLSFEWLIR